MHVSNCFRIDRIRHNRVLVSCNCLQTAKKNSSKKSWIKYRGDRMNRDFFLKQKTGSLRNRYKNVRDALECLSFVYCFMQTLGLPILYINLICKKLDHYGNTLSWFYLIKKNNFIGILLGYTLDIVECIKLPNNKSQTKSECIIYA